MSRAMTDFLAQVHGVVPPLAKDDQNVCCAVSWSESKLSMGYMLFKEYFCRWLFTTASMTLLMMESRDMERYLDGSALEFFLCTSAPEAIFHWLGKIPLVKL